MAWLTANEACSMLGVKTSTLYAYVSRGLLKAAPAPYDSRQSLYSPDDIAVLTDRKRRGRTRHDIAKSTVNWGEPVLESAITQVLDGKLYYRGQSAQSLCEHAHLEDVFRLLVGALDPIVGCPSQPQVTQSGAIGAMLYLANAANDSLPSSERDQKSLIIESADLFDRYTTALTGVSGPQRAHEKLARRWGVDIKASPAHQGDLARILVLLADHELNPSTFAARVAASTGASLPACALAGLATLTGPFHGKAANQTLSLIKAAHESTPEKSAESMAPQRAWGSRLWSYALSDGRSPRAYRH